MSTPNPSDGGYRYPDPADRITAAMIAKLEPWPGYWAWSEDRVVNRLRERLLESRARSEAPFRFLDAGCGDGRLLTRFGDVFDHIVAVEPDAERLAEATRRAERLAWSDAIEFIHAPIQAYRATAPFDFILCSHVLQHVATADVAAILNTLAASLARRGVLAVLTAHSIEPRDTYAVARWVGGEFRESAIDAEAFDRQVGRSGDGLPIRFFTRESIGRHLMHAGLRVEEFGVFHVSGDFGEPERFVERDRIVNAFPELKDRFGRDLFVRATAEDAHDRRPDPG